MFNTQVRSGRMLDFPPRLTHSYISSDWVRSVFSPPVGASSRAHRIIATDKVPERIALAKEKLGIKVINFDEVNDVVEEIKKRLLMLLVSGTLP